MEQENGWQKLFHHKWCFRGHSTIHVSPLLFVCLFLPTWVFGFDVSLFVCLLTGTPTRGRRRCPFPRCPSSFRPGCSGWRRPHTGPTGVNWSVYSRVQCTVGYSVQQSTVYIRVQGTDSVHCTVLYSEQKVYSRFTVLLCCAQLDLCGLLLIE